MDTTNSFVYTHFGPCGPTRRPDFDDRMHKIMKCLAFVMPLALAASGLSTAAEITTIKAYVDTDVCSHLLLGPISTERMECSGKAFKQGDEPVLVQLTNGAVYNVNKTKMVKEYVGKLAEATGEVKVKDGEMKLKEVKPLEASAIPAGDPARKLLDVRTYKAVGGPALYEKIRHELAMMPYISEFDFISFNLNGGDVILTGWTVRITNRSEAQNRIKNIEGITSIVNNIEVLPMGSFDMQIRAGARAALQRQLSRYFWGSGSDIKIIVKDGAIILLGAVATKTDSDIAYMQCNGVPSAFKVVNLLRVTGTQKEKG
jgi:hyperosmotically inducible protein